MTDPAVSDHTVPATEMQHLLRRSFAMRARKRMLGGGDRRRRGATERKK